MRKLLLIIAIVFTSFAAGCYPTGEQQPQAGKPIQAAKQKTGHQETASKPPQPSNAADDATINSEDKNDTGSEELVNEVAVPEAFFDSGANNRSFGDVYWSPDGKRFAYIIDEPGGTLRVYWAEIGSNSKGIKVKEFPYDKKYGSPLVSLAWSKDSGYLNYLYNSNVGPDFRPSFKMGKIEVATVKEKAFRMKDLYILPNSINWATDAGLVSFCGDGGIQRVDLATGKMTRLARINYTDKLFTVAPDPTGTKLAYTRLFGYLQSTQQKVFVLDLVTGKENQASPEGENSWNPKWFESGDKLGMLSTTVTGKLKVIVPGESETVPDCDGIVVVKPSGELIRKLQFKGETIVSFSPLSETTDMVEIYTGRKVKMTEEGGISFALDTHRIMELTKGKLVWEKKFPKVQSGENNEVEWIDEKLWINLIYTPNSETKTLFLKDISDQELAKVDGLIGKVYSVEQGLVFARRDKQVQSSIWYLNKAGKLYQLSKAGSVVSIVRVTKDKVVYLEDKDDKTHLLKVLDFSMIKS